MFKLDLVLSGLVFFAQPPASPTFTNAVLVTGSSPEEHHYPVFRIKSGKVTVKKNGNSVTMDHWDLGPKAIVTVVNGEMIPPTREPHFLSHVPSVGEAVKNTPSGKRTLRACTYDNTMPCDNQQGRIRLSGGSLNATVPEDDKEYPFLTPSFKGKYRSKLTHETKWSGSVERITITEGASTYEITATGNVEIEAGSHPDVKDAHFPILRYLYNAMIDEFPEPLDGTRFRAKLEEALTRWRGPNDVAEVRTISRPVLCPPAVQ
jgi:hypothetical protein